MPAGRDSPCPVASPASTNTAGTELQESLPLVYFHLMKQLGRRTAGSAEQWKSHPQPCPGSLSLVQEGAGRCETAMKHLQTRLGLARGWETATEGAVVEDGVVQSEGRLLPSPASASLSRKFFFKIIQREQQKAPEETLPLYCGREQRCCRVCGCMEAPGHR